MINVTKTYLPPLEEFIAKLKPSWESGWLTNNGPLVQELETKIGNFLKVPNVLFASNGTIVLQLALKALELRGEVITTPFSYVATTNAILWENLQPVFADVEPDTLCISPTEIRKRITCKTAAILATHVYGNACDVDEIQSIADQHNLRVIYDGAHAFGAKLNGTSLLSFGDIATCSFHATKLFHTVEGGSIHTSSEKLQETLFLMRQFGHYGDDHKILGINAKNSELHAAMGLCLIERVGAIIAQRKHLTTLYNQHLAGLPLQYPKHRAGLESNYAYYPIILPENTRITDLMGYMEKQDIKPRRYFRPSLNTLPYVEPQSCPVSEDIAERVLCLPMSHIITEEVIERIASSLRKFL